jgi:hypothetical protein
MLNPNQLVTALACAVLSIAVEATAASESPQAVAAQGEPFQAEIVSVDADWQVTFGPDQARRTVSAAELAWWGHFHETLHRQQVVLVDGGLLAADSLEVGKDALAVDSQLFGLIRLPLGFVAGAVLVPPADRHQRDLLLDRVVSDSGNSDRLLLTNGDELTGRIEQVRDDTLRLATDLGAIEVELYRIRALILDPSLRKRPEREGLRAMVGLRDGSRLVADRLIVDDQSLAISVLGGITSSTAKSELAALQPFGGEVTYLSDMEPAGQRHVPYLELSWPPYRADRNVTGGLLRAGGHLYLKGLGVHSASRLTYELSGAYRRFQAELAIDDDANGGGSVRFRVYLDGQPKYTSPVIRGGMELVPVTVDVTAAKRLDLIVDYADRADVLDRADWLNARLVR